MALGALIVSFPRRRESTGEPGGLDCRGKPDNDIGSLDSVIPAQAGIHRGAGGAWIVGASPTMTLGALIVSFPRRRESTGEPGGLDCRGKPNKDIGGLVGFIPPQRGTPRGAGGPGCGG